MVQSIEADLNNPNHANAVLKMLNEYAMDPMGGGEPLSDFVVANLINTLRKRSDTYIVLAFDATLDATWDVTKPVGMVMSFEGFSTFACQPLLNLHDVVVSNAYRGKGVLRSMFAKVEEIARRLGCCKLTMEILEGNKHAMAAYRAHGFAGFELDPEMGQAVFWQKKLS